MTLSEAIETTVAAKTAQGRDSSARKLMFAGKCAAEFCNIASLPLENIDRDWIEGFTRWLTENKHLSPNSRATYLRSLYSVLRAAAKDGAAVDLSAIPAELRSNKPAAPQPREADKESKPDTKYWFAMKCREVDSATMSAKFAKDFPDVETFRTDVERMVATPTGKRLRMVELLKDIIFFRTSLSTCDHIKRAWHDIAYIYDYAADGHRHPAIVKAMDMKMFMYFNDIAPDRILLYFPDEAICTTIADGTPVAIADGRFRGASGKVIGTNPANNLEATVAVNFPLLGIAATAPIPWRFLRKLNQ